MTTRPAHGTPVELKTCESCGRLFVRSKNPGQRWDEEAKTFVAKPMQRDCQACIDKPMTEEGEVHIHRSYRLIGVKI